jgi:hypothetical protein
MMPSSVTSGREWVTRGNLLVGEFSEDSVSQEFEGFGDGDSGESPARSTSSLVFNGLDGSSGNPVNISDLDEVFISNDSGFGVLHKDGVFEFFLGQIGELIDGHFVGLGGIGVVGFDFSGVFVEDS